MIPVEAVTLRTHWAAVSTTDILPLESTRTPEIAASWALVAGPPSPLKPRSVIVEAFAWDTGVEVGNGDRYGEDPLKQIFDLVGTREPALCTGITRGTRIGGAGLYSFSRRMGERRSGIAAVPTSA